jgi:predicted ATP-dependent endonuclease of OLD family
MNMSDLPTMSQYANKDHMIQDIQQKVIQLEADLRQVQASDAKLREALEYVKNEVVNPPEGLAESFTKQVIIGAIENALSTPPNTAELESFVAKARADERDKFNVVAYISEDAKLPLKDDGSYWLYPEVSNYRIPLYAKKG